MEDIVNCPECFKDISKYVDLEWDGTCPLCGNSVSIPLYRTVVFTANGHTYITKIHKVQVSIESAGEDVIRRLTDNHVIKMQSENEIVYICRKPRKLELIVEGWVDACEHLIKYKGYRKDYWTMDGIIQVN